MPSNSPRKAAFSERVDLPEGGLEHVLEAAAKALDGCDLSAADVVIYAAGAMPLGASDFDRGLAGGLALGRFLASTDNRAPTKKKFSSRR